MNHKEAVAASLITAMNDANGTVTLKIEAAINLAEKQEVRDNCNKRIILLFFG